MPRSLTVTATLAAAALSLIALTGCGASGSTAGATTAPEATKSAEQTEAAAGGDQSLADACSLVTTKMTEFSTQLNDASSELTDAMSSGDTAAAQQIVTQVGDKIDEVAAQISNADVSAAFGAYQTAWSDFEGLFTTITDAVAAQDTTALNDAAQKLTDSSTALVEAGTEIQTTCAG
ncbi:MAG TPA: hypothetical protein VEP72_00060 [Microbacterium sp.]|nr:hypothetical protein [Microbacterium sp.]